MSYYFYIARCGDGSYYCGSTNNIKRRIKQHNAGSGSKYVRSRGGAVIAYSERYTTASEAMRREAEVKTWPRYKKAELIAGSKSHTSMHVPMEHKKAAAILISLLDKHRLQSQEKQAILTAIGVLSWSYLSQTRLQARRDRKARQG